MNPVVQSLPFLGIALISSVIGAVSGIGGGIIIKPALDLLSGLGPGEITFLSGSTVLSMSLVSLLRGRKNGIPLERGRGTALAIGAALGGAGGKLVFDLLPGLFPGPSFTGVVQSLLLILLTVIVMIYMRIKTAIVHKNIRNLPACSLLGLGLGLVSAFLGIGGGPVNIMIISYFLGMDSKTTALHSLYTIFLSQAAGLIFALISGNIPAVNPLYLASMITGGITGGLLGSQFVKKLKNEGIDRLFNAVLIAVVLMSLYNLARLVRAAF